MDDKKFKCPARITDRTIEIGRYNARTGVCLTLVIARSVETLELHRYCSSCPYNLDNVQARMSDSQREAMGQWLVDRAWA